MHIQRKRLWLQKCHPEALRLAQQVSWKSRTDVTVCSLLCPGLSYVVSLLCVKLTILEHRHYCWTACLQTYFTKTPQHLWAKHSKHRQLCHCVRVCVHVCRWARAHVHVYACSVKSLQASCFLFFLILSLRSAPVLSASILRCTCLLWPSTCQFCQI